jgi:cytidine deaminase
MNYEEMIKLAEKASENAYVPYSKFPVGACVLTENGKIYTGCNFENASFGMTICAERNAIGTAIADGEKKIKAVAIFSPKMDNCTPCGACRQVMSEFKPDEGVVVITKSADGINVYSIDELLPQSFVL